ncbi:MAG TPA: Gfo/Idh/MocA family oxidoreductase, partial [Clostridia bacterium]|nr:Gfo/Idh/MocA family oxidoreductase [Clostridia bacterium]
IATPHPFHFEAARAALSAGKGVLCEKPACLWRSQVETLADIAARRNVLFVEAMWTRFLPAYKIAKQWLGSIGEVHSLTASFCALSRLGPESRLFDPALGGGALYDLGCYPLAFAQGVFGT